MKKPKKRKYIGIDRANETDRSTYVEGEISPDGKVKIERILTVIPNQRKLKEH